MAVDMTRRRFVEGSAAVGGGLAIAGPLSALAAQTAQAGRRKWALGYGELYDTKEIDSGEVYLQLPAGFRYRVISRQGTPMTDPGKNPTPGIFDGTAAYPGKDGTTILIRNHENRSRPGEIIVPGPAGRRYDPDINVRGGNTKLVVSKDRKVLEELSGAHRHPHELRGRPDPVGHVDHVRGDLQLRIGGEQRHARYRCSARVRLRGAGVGHPPREPAADHLGRAVQPRGRGLARRGALRDRGPWRRGLLPLHPRLKATGERRPGHQRRDAAGAQRPRAPGLRRRHREPRRVLPRRVGDDRGAQPAHRHGPQGGPGQGRGDLHAHRGHLERRPLPLLRLHDRWREGARPAVAVPAPGTDEGQLKLIYESTAVEDLEAPDNLVIVPHTGDVWLQEDGPDEQYIRGVTKRGEIYNFARTVVNESEFGGTFSPDGETFFVSQQGDRLEPNEPLVSTNARAALTYAIWDPFDGKGSDDA